MKKTSVNGRPIRGITHSRSGNSMLQETDQIHDEISLESLRPNGITSRYKRLTIALTVMGMVVSTVFGYALCRANPGISDFTGLMVGGHLAGTPQLYDTPANLAVQREMTGESDITRPFLRLPWVGLLVQPFKFLPYRMAVWTWRMLMIASLIVFAMVFPASARWFTALTLSWSLPILIGLGQGQDCALLLCLFGLSVWAFRKNRHFAAGLLLAFCSLKFHFLVLVPLVLIIRKEWRVLRGAAVGAAGLIGVSFAAQGLWWPVGLAGVLRQDYNTGLVLNMPNLHGLYHESWPIELISCAGVVLCIATIARFGDTDLALCAALAGAFLIAPHAYLQDVVVLVPLMLLVVRHGSWLIRLLGLVACCPLPLGVILTNSPLGVKVLAASILCFLILVTLDIRGIARQRACLDAVVPH